MRRGPVGVNRGRVRRTDGREFDPEQENQAQPQHAVPQPEVDVDPGRLLQFRFGGEKL